ncbi:MAG: hypothetical protein KAJ75_04840 [Alphaproteobacteria bacterium]|nr:hypothetical protein [Alphaproteobacteria bacterium]
MSLKEADIRAFLGKSGSGKTTLALHHLKKYKRIIIHDPNGEQALAKGAIICNTRAELLTAVKNKTFRICWRGAVGVDGVKPAVEAFEFANKVAWAVENTVAFWDETDRFCVNNSLAKVPVAYKLLNSGRHRGLRIFAASRRPQRIPRDLTALCTKIYIFQTTEPRDLKYFQELVSEEIPKIIRALKRYHYVEWQEKGYSVKKSVRV